MLLQPDPDYPRLKMERQRALNALLHLAPTPGRLAALIFRETNPMFASRMMASLSELCSGSFQQPPAEWITKMRAQIHPTASATFEVDLPVGLRHALVARRRIHGTSRAPSRPLGDAMSLEQERAMDACPDSLHIHVEMPSSITTGRSGTPC